MRPLRCPTLVGKEPRTEQHSWRPSLEPVTAMRSFEVVEAEVVLEVSRHGPQAAVVGAPERTAPQLAQDGALQTLDDAAGPWGASSWSRAGAPRSTNGVVAHVPPRPRPAASVRRHPPRQRSGPDH